MIPTTQREVLAVPDRVAVVLALGAAMWAMPARGEDSATGPRPGKYLILSYGAVGRPPLNLGSVVLKSDGTYQAFLPGDKPNGTGQFSYDASKKRVEWKSGPFKKDAFGGAFEIDRQGKTHKIRLKRTTIATNSTDS